MKEASSTLMYREAHETAAVVERLSKEPVLTGRGLGRGNALLPMTS